MGRINKKKKALICVTAICLLRRARRSRKTKSVWVRTWLKRRENLGLSVTLVKELKVEDTVEYKSMFRMDKSTFDELLK